MHKDQVITNTVNWTICFNNKEIQKVLTVKDTSFLNSKTEQLPLHDKILARQNSQKKDKRPEKLIFSAVPTDASYLPTKDKVTGHKDLSHSNS